MTDVNSAQVQALIERSLTKAQKSFITLSKVFGKTSSKANFKMIGLDRSNAIQKEIVARLELHLEAQFLIYRVGNQTYVGRNQSEADLVLAQFVTESDSKTFGILSKSLGLLSKATKIAAINTLIESGQLNVQLNANALPSLSLGVAKKIHADTTDKTDKTDKLEDPAAFRAAYDKVRGGREIARIHKLREYLGWPGVRFDAVLAALRAEYKVDLHVGDPTRLTRTEVEDSYEDSLGMFYIGISWRE